MNGVYKRILLKLSGETLRTQAQSLDPETVMDVARQIRDDTAGAQVALVIGAGNLFRGLPASRHGMTRTGADTIGMLATVMNALAMADALEAVGMPTRVQSAIPVTGVADPFDQRRAIAHLEAGRVVIFAGGTGHPFFTTDTTAALRACGIGANAVFKATKVDGIFTADPKQQPDARRYRCLAYADALTQRLGVMDATAFSLCQENNIPIVVFNFFRPNGLRNALAGDLSAATAVGHHATELDAG
jgi:uridylate kinase